MLEEHILFNDMMKSARARIEHCIGLLKNRFQMLKSLHFVLNEEKKAWKGSLGALHVALFYTIS